MTSRGELLLGAVLLLFTTMVWGGMFPVAKATLAVLDAFHMTLIRYAITAVAFLVILALVEGLAALRWDGQGARATLFGALGFAGFGLFAFVGLNYSRASHGAVIMALQPLLTALVAWLWKSHRPANFTLASAGLALLGVLLLISKGDVGALLTGTGLGDLLILLGALSWVVYTLGAASFNGWSPLRYTALTCAPGVGALLVATVAAWAVGYAHVPTLAELADVRWEMTYLVVLASIAAVLFWNIGIKKLGPVNGVLFINFVPITALSIRLLQGETYSAVELGGAGLVIAALVANNLYARRLMARPAPATLALAAER